MNGERAFNPRSLVCRSSDLPLLRLVWRRQVAALAMVGDLNHSGPEPEEIPVSELRSSLLGPVQRPRLESSTSLSCRANACRNKSTRPQKRLSRYHLDQTNRFK